ncbi:hypothetical protein FOA24_37410 [Bacillus thuringiensis]
MQATINNLNETVDSLKNVICDLEKELSGKVNVTDIQQVIKPYRGASFYFLITPKLLFPMFFSTLYVMDTYI